MKKSVVLLLLLTVLSCATRQPGDPLTPGYNQFSKQDDIELGRQAAQEVRQQVDVVDNQELQNYVRQIGQLLAKQPQADDYPYTFTLINDPSINAFALPGGPTFMHSGLIAAADSEAQFAGVIAHEISHVALRHGTSQASKAQMVQLPAALAGAILGDGSALGQLGQLGIGLGANALVMKYSRNAEKEADALGARIMSAAGYDPIAMAQFFEKLEAQGGARPPALLSSHPSPGNRVALVQAEMETFPTGRYGARTGDFNRAKQLVARLPEPKIPQARQASAGSAPAPPSGGFQTLRGRDFSVAYPEGWRQYGDQSSGTLTLAPPEGIVQNSNGGGSIGYGAVLSAYEPRYRTDLLNSTWEIVQQMQEMDPNLRVSDEPRRMTVQGNQAMVVGLTGRSPYGGSERDLLLTIQRPGQVIYMVFVAPSDQYQQLRPTFERMAQSIQFR